MPDLDALLLLTGAATSVRWAWTHRVRPLDSDLGWDDPLPDWGEKAPPSLTEMWNDRVGCPHGALIGSTLEGIAPIRNGREARIQLVPGKQSTVDAMGATAKVCSALQLPAGSVVVEPTRDGRADHARLLVVDDNPQHRKQFWIRPQLSLETGTAPVGVYADETEAHVRWLTPGSGATNVLVAGSPGWGKSRFLDWLLCESMSATYLHPETGAEVRWVQTWLGDGQQGQSVPDWLDVVDWPATSTSEILRMLRSAKRVMDARSRYLARFRWVDDKGRERRGVKHFDPIMTGLSLLQVVIDECHAPLAELDEIVALSKELARKGRKCGIRLVYATQVPSVQNLGNDIDLRSLLSGNVVCFRTKDRISGGMAFAGWGGVDPSTLPEEFPNGDPAQGMAYVLGPGARPAPMRNYLVDDPYDAVVDLSRAKLLPFERKAAGDDYASRWERIRAELDDEAFDDSDDNEPGQSGPQLDPAPIPILEEPTPEPAGVPAVRDMVLTAVEAGARRTADVNTAVQAMAAAHGVTRSPRAIGDALRELSKPGGPVVRLGQGRYALLGNDEAAA